MYSRRVLRAHVGDVWLSSALLTALFRPLVLEYDSWYMRLLLPGRCGYTTRMEPTRTGQKPAPVLHLRRLLQIQASGNSVYPSFPARREMIYGQSSVLGAFLVCHGFLVHFATVLRFALLCRLYRRWTARAAL